jgi:hypothetical protein
MTRDERADLAAVVFWAAVVAVAAYALARTPVRRLLVERLPSHAEVTAVLRDAERITREASAHGGPTMKGE